MYLLCAGTGIQLFGNTSQSTYSFNLDNSAGAQPNSTSVSDGLLADFHDLDDTNHTLTLTVHTTSPSTPDSYIDFDGATIIYTDGNDNNDVK